MGLFLILCALGVWTSFCVAMLVRETRRLKRLKDTIDHAAALRDYAQTN